MNQLVHAHQSSSVELLMWGVPSVASPAFGAAPGTVSEVSGEGYRGSPRGPSRFIRPEDAQAIGVRRLGQLHLLRSVPVDVFSLRNVRGVDSPHAAKHLEHVLDMARLATIFDARTLFPLLLFHLFEHLPTATQKLQRADVREPCVSPLDRAPWRIRFEVQPVQRDLRGNGQVLLRLERAAIEPNMQPQRQ